MKEAFTLDIRSTQLSESLNSSFKACMKPGINIIQFFKHFERVDAEKRYNESRCEYESRHKLPRIRYGHSPILRQLAEVYTHIVFDLFHHEFDLFLATNIRQRNESQYPFEYVIALVGVEGGWKVLFDPVQSSISCSCRKFETFGILCCHALKVFEANDVKIVPDQYILKRWTKNAQSGIIFDARRNEVMEDPKLSSIQRYKQLCPIMIRLVADVSPFEDLHELVQNGMHDLCNEVKEVRLQKKANAHDEGEVPTITAENVTQPRGFKN